MQIKLNTIDDVIEFVLICSHKKYNKYNIKVQQNYQIVNAKSIMGMFSLNLLESMRIVFANDCWYDLEKDIKKWIIT